MPTNSNYRPGKKMGKEDLCPFVGSFVFDSPSHLYLLSLSLPCVFVSD